MFVIDTKYKHYIEMSIPKKVIIVVYALSALFSRTDAQTISCNSRSPNCCWVWRIREIMKLSLAEYSTIDTSCCSVSGLQCVGDIVTKFEATYQNISGSIPTEFQYLTNLTNM